MPKSMRHGQALTLTPEQLDAIMSELNPICRAALSVCRFTAARVTEGLSLRWENITSTDIIIPKSVTKKKMKTRTIPMNPKLWEELGSWRQAWPLIFKRDLSGADYLFPGHKDTAAHLTRRNVDYALRAVCNKLGIEGCSTHSFRRSALTAASDKGVPLRVLQSISGHSSLEMLQRYLDVKDEQKRQAALAFG
jgi:integrase/recombinase XerD